MVVGNFSHWNEGDQIVGEELALVAQKLTNVAIDAKKR
jgi:hypothetical protein